MSKKLITDGAYTNMVTGAGTLSMDKSMHTFASPYTSNNVVEFARMKVTDGIADRIICCVPEATFKGDITIVNDTDGVALKKAYELGLFEVLQNASENQRLTGGAIVVTEYDTDNGIDDLKQEPPKDAFVKSYRQYSSNAVQLEASDFDGDAPRIYKVELLDGRIAEIDPSRVTVIYGKKLPDALKGAGIKEFFFGVSALSTCERDLKNLAGVLTSVVNMAEETGTAVFSMEGLTQMLSKPDCGVRDIQQLMSTIKLGMNTMRAVFAGENDKFQILSHNFGGLPEIIQKLMVQLSADCGIPISILFGQSATGLSQTNKSDVESFNTLVEQWRMRYLYKPMCKLIADFTRRNLGNELNEFNFGALGIMSELDKVDAMQKQAQTMQIYYNMGVLSAEEIRTNVFVNGHSFDVSVEA